MELKLTEIEPNNIEPMLCLNMIVKNESHIIKDTLQKLLDKIKFDYWVISDTGSTDNTKEIIVDFFKEKNIKGEIYDDDWIDFGHNRTKALERAYSKSKYVLIFDADDEIVGNFVLPNMTKDCYYFQFGSSFGVSYIRVQIVNNKKKWKYVGVLHEVITCLENNESSEVIKGDYFTISGRTSSRNKEGNKYYKDALILEKAYYDCIKNNDELYNRYGFYCANSFFDAGKFTEAIKWYKITLNNKNWSQEKYMSCLRIFQAYEALKETEIGIFYLVKSFEYDKERVECLLELIKYYCINNQNDVAYGYYSIIKDYYENKYLNDTTNDKLFLDVGKAEFYLPYYMAIVCDKIGKNNSAKNILKILFTKKFKEFGSFFVGNFLFNIQFFIEHFKDDKDFINLFQSYIDFLYKNNYPLHNHDFLDIYKKYGININTTTKKEFTQDDCFNSKKILFYTGYSPAKWNYTYSLNNALGGSETAVLCLAKELSNNYEIYIAGNVNEETKDNIKFIDLNNIGKLLKENAFNTIIISRYLNFYELYPYFMSYKTFIWGHDIVLFPYGTSLSVEQILEKYTNKINGCICQTEWHKNLFLSLYPQLNNKIFTINNGIDLNLFQNKNNKIANRFIYTSCTERGLERLLELWPSITNELPDAELYISSYNSFPHNEFENNLNNIIKQFSNIKHVGRLNKPELYKLMSSAEYWLYPTNFNETSCITAMEMLMNEVICIYYPLAGLVNTLGDYGIPIKNGNELNTILNLTTKQKFEMRKSGKKYAMSCSWNNRMTEWTNVINNTNCDNVNENISSTQNDEILIFNPDLHNIKYGSKNKNIDITDYVLNKLINENMIQISNDDTYRASLFGDPLFGILKTIFITDKSNVVIKEYKPNCDIIIPIDNEKIKITVNDEVNYDKTNNENNYKTEPNSITLNEVNENTVIIEDINVNIVEDKLEPKELIDNYETFDNNTNHEDNDIFNNMTNKAFIIYENDYDLDFRIKYGTWERTFDITEQVLQKFVKDDIIHIPTDDSYRANVFGDPYYSVAKSVFIVDSTTNDIIRKYDSNDDILINLTYKSTSKKNKTVNVLGNEIDLDNDEFIFYDKNITIKYGNKNKNIDITDYVFENLIKDDTIFIPLDDTHRSCIFGDPLFGIRKSVFIYDNDGILIKEYKFNEEVIYPLKRKFNTNCIKVVNLKRRPDRKSQIINQLNIANIKNYDMIEAIDGIELKNSRELQDLFKDNNFNNRNGVIGCALSHLKLWNQLINDENNNYYVILEDDIELYPNFKKKLIEHCILFQKYDVEHLSLGVYDCNKEQQKKIYTDSIKIFKKDVYKFWNITFAYIISKNAAKKIIDFTNKCSIKCAIDNPRAYGDILTYYHTTHCITEQKNVSLVGSDITTSDSFTFERDNKEIKIRICDFWTDGYDGDKFDSKNNFITDFFQKANKKYTLVDEDNEPDIVIYSAFGGEHERYKNKRRIFYCGEPFPPRNVEYNITFYPTENNNFRFPLWAAYLNDYLFEECNRRKNGIINIPKRNKFCSFISGGEFKSTWRREIVEKLSKYKRVDCGGGFLNNIGYIVPRGKTCSGKIEHNVNYKFAIAFENEDSLGYVTEKICDIYKSNCIPIYAGNKEVINDFNPSTFINANDFANLDDLVEYVIKVDNDDELYSSFFKEPFFSNKWLDIFNDPHKTFYKNITDCIIGDSKNLVNNFFSSKFKIDINKKSLNTLLEAWKSYNLDYNYKFPQSNNWFNYSELKSFILNKLNHENKFNILEIGSFEGCSSCFLSDILLNNDESSLVCVDPFISDGCNKTDSSKLKNIFYDNIKKSNNYEKIKIYEMYSNEFYNMTNKNLYNFIYIDGEHTDRQILADLNSCFELLEIDGILWCDDYNNNWKNTFLKWINENKNKIEIIHEGYQLGLKKINEKLKPNINIFNIWHNKLFDNCYETLDEYSLDKIIMYDVNPSYEKIYNKNKKYNMLNEYNFKNYNGMLQEANYCQTSCFYHVYTNELYKNLDYIGFIQYDMVLHKDFIYDIENKISNSNDNIFFYSLIVPNKRDVKYICKPYNNSILEKYNNYFNTNHSYDSISAHNKSNYFIALHTFVIPTKIFIKLMEWYMSIQNWLHINYLKKIYEESIAEITESIFGLFLLLQLIEDETIKLEELNLYHEWPKLHNQTEWNNYKVPFPNNIKNINNIENNEIKEINNINFCFDISTKNTEWSIKNSNKFEKINFIEITKNSFDNLSNLFSLDKLIKINGLPEFINIDIDFFEYECLRTLTQKNNNLRIKWTSKNLDIILNCINHLHKYNYNNFYVQINDDDYTFRPKEFYSINDAKNILSQTKVNQDWGFVWCK
jgi:GR25 family glycosyltransferase involved in LPS biosynthesis